MKVKAAITETNGNFYLTVLATTPFIGWCKYCNQLNPPGWMHQPDICDSCAEKHLGIIH